MNFNEFYCADGEKPLDRLVSDGGFCGIFRTIGIIGDSLSSGEFESKTEGITGFHDFYEYSWGQYLARAVGCKVYNFSRGGMSAEEFCKSFATTCGVFDYENLCQAYIIALGVNDLGLSYPVGKAENGALCWPYEDNRTIIGFYREIIRRVKQKQPQAKFFLVTVPNDTTTTDCEYISRRKELNSEIRKIADFCENVYIIDLETYAPPFDEKFHEVFFRGHMTAAGYILFSKMIMSYMDYIIRANPEEFAFAGFIGTPYKYELDN